MMKRENYFIQMRSFYDKDLIKMITGIRTGMDLRNRL